MLRISTCILYLTSFQVQSMCYVSRRYFAKPNKMKKLMKELKLVYGALIETNSEKKKRLKLEKKGKIPVQKVNNIDTELSWIMGNSSNNLKKIILFKKPQSEHKDVIPSITKSILHSDQAKRTDTNSPADNFINFDKDQTNPKDSKIEWSADRNIENICHSESNQVRKVGLEITNPMCNSSIITKDNNNYDEVTAVTKYPQCSQSISMENKTLRNNESLANSNVSDVENKATKHESSDLGKLSDIVIKNLPSFSIMGSKQEFSIESAEEILSVSGKDDPSTIKFPSVTKILTQTMPLESKLALEAWKKKMIKKLGQEGFDMHKKALLEDGASLHSCIAQSLLGKEYEVPSRIEPVFKSVQCVLDDVNRVKAIETYVAHTKLYYKGIIDCVASYRGENYVIDWKRSERKKLNLKETYDAPIQVAAYIGAINASNLYPFVIKRGLVVIAYTCGAPATVHEMCGNTLQQYWTAWLRRLQQYYVEMTNNDDNESTR